MQDWIIHRLVRRVTSSPTLAPVLSGAGALLLVRVASLLLGYLGTLLIVRWLGAAQAGIYIYCISLIASFSVASNLGFSRASLRFVAQYRARGQSSLLAGLIQTARRVTLATSVVLGLAGIAAIAMGHTDPAWRAPLMLAFASIPFAALLILNTDTALGFGWTTFAYLPDQLVRNVATIGGIGTYVALRGTADAKDAAAIMLVAYAAIVGYQLLGLKSRAQLGNVRPERDMPHWIVTSLPLWLAALSDILIERIDLLLIGYFLPAQNIAIFNAASRTATLAIMIQYAVIAPSNSVVAGLYARGRIDELNAFVKGMLFWTIWPSAALVLLLALAGPTILRVFGPEFSRGEPVFYTLLVAQMIGICMGPGYTLLSLTGYQTAMMVTIASATAISALLNWILIPLAGIEGAAVATGFSIVFRAAALAILARRYLGIRTISFMPPPPARAEQT